MLKDDYIDGAERVASGSGWWPVQIPDPDPDRRLPMIRFSPSGAVRCLYRVLRAPHIVCMLFVVGVGHSLAVADDATATRASAAAAESTFPAELVEFVPADRNPVFAAEGPGHWDVKIRERGWILRDGDIYRMWFTGYDGNREGSKMLGYATSMDGLTWIPDPRNPIYREQWVEDMMVVKVGQTYYMFAEGAGDRAQLLTSPDGINWTRKGRLDIRETSGEPIAPGPFGTPTAWFEKGTWSLFYERGDRGVWLATSRDMRVWTNVQDEPVLSPGPGEYDRDLIALNQIIKHGGRYYAYYHGASRSRDPALWTTNIAVSDDLIHWEKYSKNPLFPVEDNKSSGIVVQDGQGYRLYTMHNRVDVHFPQSASGR